jgi:hypothetical protein
VVQSVQTQGLRRVELTRSVILVRDLIRRTITIGRVQQFEEIDDPGLDGLLATGVSQPCGDFNWSLWHIGERDVPSAKDDLYCRNRSMYCMWKSC